MTDQPQPAKDRLAEIEGKCGWLVAYYDLDDRAPAESAEDDVFWLIAEVKRHRAWREAFEAAAYARLGELREWWASRGIDDLKSLAPSDDLLLAAIAKAEGQQ